MNRKRRRETKERPWNKGRGSLIDAGKKVRRVYRCKEGSMGYGQGRNLRKTDGGEGRKLGRMKKGKELVLDGGR